MSGITIIYSSPPLIRPPYLRTNCGHIREVAFGEREKSIDFIVVRTENSGLIRGVASREWPLREGPLYYNL